MCAPGSPLPLHAARHGQIRAESTDKTSERAAVTGSRPTYLSPDIGCHVLSDWAACTRILDYSRYYAPTTAAEPAARERKSCTDHVVMCIISSRETC